MTDRGQAHPGCSSPLPSTPLPGVSLPKSHPLTSSPVGKSHEAEVEAEYDRLRDLARDAARQRSSCMSRSQAAFKSGDGAAAKSLSEEGKKYGREMERWNKAASDFIFREENADQPQDTIDLHGQFAEEAEDIVEEAIKVRKGNGETHLRVIVGKGNHSVGGVMKIRPRVEKVCGELGLNWKQEQNAGVLFIDLTGGNANPENHQYQKPQHQQGHQQQHSGGQAGYPGHQQQPSHGGQHGAQHQQQEENAGADIVTMLLKKLEKACCVMM